MGKSSSDERRKLKEQGHWSVSRIFVPSGSDEPITARQVRHLVSSGELDPQTKMRVLGKRTVIDAQRVIDVLEKEQGNAVPYGALLRPPERVAPQPSSEHVGNSLEPSASLPSAGERRPLWNWRESVLAMIVTRLWFIYTAWVRRTNTWLAVGLTLLTLYVSLSAPTAGLLQSNPQLSASALLLVPIYVIMVPFSFASFAMLVAPFMWIGDRIDRDWWIAIWGSLALLVVLAISTAFWSASITSLRTVQLVPVPDLVKSCMAKEVRVGSSRRGAVCADGWRSRATGSGACSHHGGVAYWTYETRRRSAEECKAWAEKVSWR